MLKLAHHDLGGTGPVLLLLHANGLLGRVFQPMVDEVLSAHFHCIAVDAVGHGESPAWQGPGPLTAHIIVDAVYDTIVRLGIRGCFVFGQSLGAATALMVEHMHPGTFTAIYAYEPPVLTTISAHRIMAWEHKMNLKSPGPLLETMALKRRSRFESRDAAGASLQAKLPFSTWRPSVFGQYMAHGVRRTQGEDGMWELSCAPHAEAAVYRAMEPPPVIEPDRVKCPVVWAIGGGAKGIHSRLPRLGLEQVAELQRGVLEVFPPLSHFGPQEAPKDVGLATAAFYAKVQAGEWPREGGKAAAKAGSSNGASTPTVSRL